MSVDTRTSGPLSAEQVERFEREGVLVLDDPCPPELVDEVLADVEPMYRDAFDEGPYYYDNGVVYNRETGAWKEKGYHWHRIQNAWKIRDSIRSVALAPRVVGMVEQLFGRKVKPFQTLNFPLGTEQPPHADSFFFQSEPLGYMCGVWVALEDMDMNNGPLLYYPGSHKIPMPSWEEIEQHVGKTAHIEDVPDWDERMKERGGIYTQYMRDLLEREGFEPAYGTVRKGQAVVWSPNLIHGGSPQTDRSRTRHSQVSHYFFEGCRVYTPLQTDGDHVYWHYPEWIQDPVPQYGNQLLHDTISEHAPKGAKVLIASNGDEGALATDTHEASHFPQDEGGDYLQREFDDSEAVSNLERLRDQGAEYIVFPHDWVWGLEFKFPQLQERLENTYRRVYDDGGIAVIYALRD
jgi:ectoine hydroxylase-related dioxygenase (phytanoyl-CoA dioxygenase family)